MEDVSVSKGVFAHGKNMFGKKKKIGKISLRYSHKSKPWYIAFKKTWLAIENAASDVNTNTFRKILTDLKSFVTQVKNLPLLTDEIPTGILLAGVNLPDHSLLLDKLVIDLEIVTPYIAIVWSRDAASLKSLIEEIVFQIINRSRYPSNQNHLPVIKKSQCTFCALHTWYKETNNGNTPLVIIIPDFESFSPRILHDFILMLSSYLTTIKFVLVFGVATTLHVVHRSLSYDATSKLKVQVFHTQTQIQSLSNLLYGIVLSPNIPFKLTGQTFKLLIDTFLWYDFSVNSFLQCYKICMWKHFYNQNEKLICCNQEDFQRNVSLLTDKDKKRVKKLASLTIYSQSLQKLPISNSEFKEMLINLWYKFHAYSSNFLILLKCLYKITVELPGNRFGKNFREIYAIAVGKVSICETEMYKEAIQLIGFLSKEELLSSVQSVLSTLCDNHELELQNIIEQLEYYIERIKNASLDISLPIEEDKTLTVGFKNRLKFQEELKQKTLKPRFSPYKDAQVEFIDYLDKEVFTKYLKCPNTVPLNEIFCYDDRNTVKNYITGSMKAAIHNGLGIPNYYLECKCCLSNQNDILPTHPDLNIVYKLHLESRKIINIYDWLQTFLSIVDPDKTEEEQDVDPLLQARFTRAVAELQFLGYIKTTRIKTDHVKRLT